MDGQAGLWDPPWTHAASGGVRARPAGTRRGTCALGIPKVQAQTASAASVSAQGTGPDGVRKHSGTSLQYIRLGSTTRKGRRSSNATTFFSLSTFYSIALRLRFQSKPCFLRVRLKGAPSVPPGGGRNLGLYVSCNPRAFLRPQLPVPRVACGVRMWRGA